MTLSVPALPRQIDGGERARLNFENAEGGNAYLHFVAIERDQ
jgi:hypothetical protein